MRSSLFFKLLFIEPAIDHFIKLIVAYVETDAFLADEILQKEFYKGAKAHVELLFALSYGFLMKFFIDADGELSIFRHRLGMGLGSPYENYSKIIAFS